MEVSKTQGDTQATQMSPWAGKTALEEAMLTHKHGN